MSRLLAQAADRGVHLESDYFFHAIVSGYIPPWTAEADSQNQGVMRVAGETAAAFAKAGYFTVLDGAFLPHLYLPRTIDLLAEHGVETRCVILLPDLETAITRAAMRDLRPLSRRDVITQLWQEFQMSTKFDVYRLEVADKTAQQVAAEISARGEEK